MATRLSKTIVLPAGCFQTATAVGHDCKSAGAVAAVLIVLHGGLEFSFPKCKTFFAGAGTVIATDWLLRGGSVSRFLAEARVLSSTIPSCIATISRSADVFAKPEALRQAVQHCRFTGRRQSGRQRDPRRQAQLGCHRCAMADLFANALRPTTSRRSIGSARARGPCCTQAAVVQENTRSTPDVTVWLRHGSA